jgi:glycine oxidase
VPENWNAKKAFQLDSLLMAQSFWDDVRAGGSDSGYARTGRLQPIADAAALNLARTREGTAKELWQNHAEWRVVQDRPDHWYPQSPSGWFIRDTLSALVHPRQACDALVTALNAKGITVQSEGDAKGTTVWATGVSGLQDFSASHHRSVGSGVKGQAALLEYDARSMPQIFGHGIHVIPHQDGTVAVGSTSEREYSSPDQTDAQLDDVIETARTLVPALKTATVIDRWAGVRPRARSRAPMLGAWPDRPGHFIANGGFKIGFGMAPKVAQVMVDLILDGHDTIPDGFRVEDNL